MSNTFRLIPLDKPTPAAFNMAADEVLLDSAPAQPVLRFYQWSEDSVSIGYFQNPQEAAAKFDNNPVIVRRPTGGGTVSHGKDLTLSLVLPAKFAHVSSRAVDAYRDIHAAFLNGMRTLHPKLESLASTKKFSPRNLNACFDAPVGFDIGLDGKKVLGSSQRRRNGTLLNQTAVFLPGDAAKLAEAIALGVQKTWNLQAVRKPFTKDELKAIEHLALTKTRC